ncbi:MAG: tetratricopeptide repeat protein [Intrasporangium sp.]|uniref:tetratricopeptide repeat protein n=1 Tax=Intrasporangium sp. TaxID=1925024 RepID=UPI00264970A6|nr:tetratricopeptide repeat protein [Intrasporangium sp.]MDN5795816.1 tetratricopeptide repeat protein [Intrasporangium sp.]
MTQQPFTAAALRGAVDLSGLSRPAPAPGATGAAGAAPGSADQLVIEVTDASIRDVIGASASHPIVLVLWSTRLAETADFVATLRTVAQRYGGRFQLATADVDTNPAILQAFQVRAVPVTFALVQGQPVPLFEGVQPEDQIGAVVDQVLALAAQQGVTGTVSFDGAPSVAEAQPPTEPPLSPLHQEAFDAIEAGDLDRALDAYRDALAQNPADADAKVGMAQVELLRRTQGVDPAQARAAAAADPTDVDAQILAADLDLLGGHIEDAFLRLIDTVRRTGDADRDKAREHLVELFDVVGVHDDRVAKARKSLMSALF